MLCSAAPPRRKEAALIETTETGYPLLDGAGRVLDANAEYVRPSGHLSRDEILGRFATEWTAPYDRQRSAAAIESCLAARASTHLEIKSMVPNGTITPVDISVTARV